MFLSRPRTRMLEQRLQSFLRVRVGDTVTAERMSTSMSDKDVRVRELVVRDGLREAGDGGNT